MADNQLAQAKAFRKAKAKSKRILELGITAGMDQESIDKIVLRLAEAKAMETMGEVTDFLSGQQWYVEDLVAYANLDGTARYDKEYDFSFSQVASKAELLSVLDGLAA